MREPLTAKGYEFTKSQLRKAEAMLAELESRTDLTAEQIAGSGRSYLNFINQLKQDIADYEALNKESPELVAS